MRRALAKRPWSRLGGADQTLQTPPSREPHGDWLSTSPSGMDFGWEEKSGGVGEY